MKQAVTKKTSTVINLLLAALIAGVPFYAFITVWLNSLVGGYSLWQLWPEVLLLVLSGAAVIVLFKDRPRLAVLSSDHLAWIALALIIVIAIWTAAGYVSGGVSLRSAMQGFVFDARLPVAFLAAYILAPYAKIRWRWLLAPAAVVVVVGLLQAFVLPNDVLKHFGYGPATIPVMSLVDQKPDYLRVQSTLRGANPLGAYLVVVVTAAAVAVIMARERWRSLALGVLSGVVLIYTYSRSAYLGTAVAVLIAGWYVLARYRRWILIGLAAVTLLFAGSLVALRDNDRFQNVFFHTDETSQSARSSNEDRFSALTNGLQEVAKQPLGNGVGSAGPASVHNDAKVRISENYYMQLGQELGWLGLALFVALNALVFYRLWLQRTRPWAIVLLASGLGLIIVNCLSHAWTDPTLAYTWWLLAGLVLGSAILPAESSHKNVQKIHKTDRT